MNEAPTPPAPNECCESGCVPCVWDVYYEALRQWQEAQAQNTENSATE
jgi:cytochrome-b5 reductase